MKVLVFACGATYRTENEPEVGRNGRPVALLVFANCSEGPKSPKMGAHWAPCLLGCPSSARSSSRKVFRAWVGEAAKVPRGEPVLCVTCRPLLCIEDEGGALEA